MSQVEHDALLWAICDTPSEDAPRLVYSDWLEEHDCLERAEFIRVQLALEEETEEGPRRWALQKRQNELLQANQAEWTEPLRELVLGEEYHRGFVDTVTLTLEGFLERAETIFGLAPVQRVRLIHRPGVQGTRNSFTDAETALKALVRSPLLARVRGLHLDLALNQPMLQALAACRHLHGLEELNVQCAELDERAMLLFLELMKRQRLRRLEFGARSVEPGVVRAFSEAESLGHVESLSLRLDLSRRDEFQALMNSPFLTSLRSLDLSISSGISVDTLPALASPILNHLEELNLRGRYIDDRGVHTLAEMPMPQLRRLDLASNNIWSSGARALASSSSLSNVRFLNLRGNVLASQGLTALARSPFLTNLRCLLLHFNGVGDIGVESLARSPTTRELVWLELIANRVTRRGARALAKSSHLPNLSRLELARNDIDKPSQRALRERFGAGLSV